MKLLLFTTLSFLFYTLSFCQKPERYTALEPGNICSKNITLYTNGSYLFEEGCEASSQLSFGKWSMKRDTVKLEPVDPKTYAVVKSVEATAIPGDSIWVTILDRDGMNMTAKISIGLEVGGRGSYMFSPDVTGIRKFVYKRTGGKILLRTLNKLFGQPIELSTGTANNFIITLNLQADWISSTHAAWSGIGAFRLLKKSKTLVSISPQLPARIVFTLSE